jgi:hypothetical protein
VLTDAARSYADEARIYAHETRLYASQLNETFFSLAKGLNGSLTNVVKDIKELLEKPDVILDGLKGLNGSLVNVVKDVREMLEKPDGLLDVIPWPKDIGNDDCCPTVVEISIPSGGKNNKGLYRPLYRPLPKNTPLAVDDASIFQAQKFYEISCEKRVLNMPCRFNTKSGVKMLPGYRCIQQWSYAFALVEMEPSDSGRQGPFQTGNATFKYDYVRVRSGCGCSQEIPASMRRYPGQ